MKEDIAKLISAALVNLPELSDHPELSKVEPEIEGTRDVRHGDYASNIALRLAKQAGCKPRDLADAIVAQLPSSPIIENVTIAGPGFINFHVAQSASFAVIADILGERESFGLCAKKASPHILVEYVSANPTGPLHVGHGRGAAYGDSVSRLLAAAGYPVTQEYYVNDAGRQMEILAISVLARYLARRDGTAARIPAAGYQGEYIGDISANLDADLGNVNVDDLYSDLPTDAPEGDADLYIDALIERAESVLGQERFTALRHHALNAVLDDIRDDLAEFGVTPDLFFSEESLATDGTIDQALEALEKRGKLYRKGGATWFRATDHGDEKDRVVVRDNGKKTYFASDIAYHFGKRERGFDVLLDILGSDHHGYVARVRAGLEALGYAGDSLEVKLIQFVTLYRDGKKAQMSTRSGSFVTLRQLREEVGNDAARLFYVMRSQDQHLDFDLDLAKSKSNENPVYYIQYAHARVASVFRQLAEKSLQFDENAGLASLDRLVEPQEKSLAAVLTKYGDLIVSAAEKRAPHLLVNYLRELATEFHSYYNAHPFIVEDGALRDARLALIGASRQVLANGLTILGVSAPESM